MRNIKKLDAVLHAINANSDLGDDFCYDKLLAFAIEKDLTSVDEDVESELNMISHKLYKEGYIHISSIAPKDDAKNNQIYYTVTFDGRIFIENGGYVQKYKRERHKYFYQDFAMWITAIGTGLAGIYGTIEIIKWLNG